MSVEIEWKQNDLVTDFSRQNICSVLLNTSSEVIWPKKISNSMHGSKSAILAIFQTGPGWPCTVSAALKNPSQVFKNSFCIGCR